MDLDPLPQVFTTAQWLATGRSVSALRTARRRGRVVRVAHGLHATTRSPPASPDPDPYAVRRDGYLDAARAALDACEDGYVASHLTAAAALGLPMPLGPWRRPHLTAVEAYQRSRQGAKAQMHHCDSTLTGICETDRLPATTAARTVADCLRCFGPRVSVPVADAALHRGLCVIDDVLTELAAQVRWRGRPRAYVSLGLVDGRRESWLESWAAVWLDEHRLPRPEPQVAVFDETGTFVGRVDGLWEAGVAAELDGRFKYGRDAEETAPGESGAVYAEKLREDALRDTGLTVVRWGLTHMLDRPQVTADRIRRRLAVGAGRTISGFLRRTPATGLTLPDPD